jgi:hypothetical protein
LYVEACTAGYNKRYQDSLEMSPHEVVFGYKPRLPQFTDITQPTYKKAKHHFKGLDILRETARENIRKHTLRNTKQANKSRRVPPLLRAGELVLLRRPKKPEKNSKQTKKFLPNYTKPYKIVSRISDLIYTIRPLDKPDAKPEIAHISKMKRFFPKTVNCLTIVSPVSGKTIELKPEQNVTSDFTANEIHKTVQIIVLILTHYLGRQWEDFKCNIPYNFMANCKNLFAAVHQ